MKLKLDIKKTCLLFFAYIVFYLFLEILTCTYMLCTAHVAVKNDFKNYGLKILYSTYDFKDKNYDKYIHKPIIMGNSKKNSIGIFGCSFGYGGEENFFANDLSRLTGRSVYNYSIQAAGPQMMYYAIERNKVNFDDIDTYIYVYIDDHQERCCKFRCGPFVDVVFPKYNLRNNNTLQIVYPDFFRETSYIYRGLEYVFPFYYKNGKYAENLFCNVVLQSFERLKNKNPNIRFILLNYSDYKTEDLIGYEQFKKAGIEIVSVNDLTGENMFQVKYQLSPIDSHPNGTAWNMIAKELVKKSNL